MENQKEAPLHGGHRERMRQRFLETGGKGMADHEILEMLLFYALPRRDTNETAHCLIEECGSLSGVLEADIDHLCHTVGVKENTALYLRLLGETARRYTVRQMEGNERVSVYDSPDRIAAFLAPRYVGVKVERVFLLLFDNGMHMIDCHHVGDGSVSGVTVTVRPIVEHAFRKGAAAAILAHNHPGGLSIPSGDDLRVTRRLDEAFRLMEIPLLEHYVFGTDGYRPIMALYRAPSDESYASSSLCDLLRRRLNECRGTRE
ncbi:MAG: RadC family protein [Clostridia bacterium]|nr:RadC family protein [Clostridia bacterium]